jgi:hypothetical protein
MPKLYSSDYIVKVLGEAIVLANRKEIPTGTFRSILRQASLTEADFK